MRDGTADLNNNLSRTAPKRALKGQTMLDKNYGIKLDPDTLAGERKCMAHVLEPVVKEPNGVYNPGMKEAIEDCRNLSAADLLSIQLGKASVSWRNYRESGLRSSFLALIRLLRSGFFRALTTDCCDPALRRETLCWFACRGLLKFLLQRGRWLRLRNTT